LVSMHTESMYESKTFEQPAGYGIIRSQ